MLILVLDTSTRAGSVAVTDGDRVLAVRAGDATRTHGERLPAELDAVLIEAGADRRAIDLLVVASGPGAFTGLRIGLAAMQGLAMTLSRPIVGVSALDALAWTMWHEVLNEGRPNRDLDLARPHSVATWMDALRGEVFSAVYRGPAGAEMPRASSSEPSVGAPELALRSPDLDRRAAIRFAGDGARRYADAIAAASPHWTVARHDPPLAPALAWLGRRQARDGGPTTPHALQPLYVRRPDVEIERDRHLA